MGNQNRSPRKQPAQSPKAAATGSAVLAPAPLGVAPGAASVTRVGRLNPARIWQAARTTLRGQFIALALLIVLFTVLHTWYSVTSFARATAALETIGSSSLPSVDAAQAMGQYMEDLDSYSSDYLAANALPTTEDCAVMGTDYTPGAQTIHGCADVNLDAESVLVNKQLVAAARNITFPGEQTAVERITTGFQEYLDNIAVMRHEFSLAASKTNPSDPHLQAARAAYENANKILHTKINRQPTLGTDGKPAFDETVPDCTPEGGKAIAGSTWPLGSVRDNLDCLSSINKGQLDATYRDTTRQLLNSQVVAGVLGLLFSVLLLVTAWRMLRITHRVLNIALTLAVVIGLGYSAVVVVRLAAASGSFTQAINSYDGVYAAAILERYSTVANNDEAHWLIAVAFSDQPSADAWFGDWQQTIKVVQAYMQRAKDNRAWPEEDAPLADMQTAWDKYYALDGQMRKIATDASNPNRALDAETLGVGASDDAYTAFVDAVDKLSAIKHDHFTQLYDGTLAALRQSLLLSAVLFPLAGVLGILGIYRRLKEF